IISAVNALTLSPALCAIALKPQSEEKERKKKKNLMQRFHAGFNRGFNATLNKYTSSLYFLNKHRWITPAVIILAGLGIWWSSSNVSTGFVPDEDRGIVFANVELPVGASLDRTVQAQEELTKKALEIPGVSNLSTVAGYSMLSGQGQNFGIG